MQKSLILVILSVFLFTSCGFKNPLSKMSNVTYIDCPKTLILAPASKIIDDQITLNLNKNYSMTCYSSNLNSSDVFFDFDYVIDSSYNDVTNLSRNFNFIVFITNKSESEKIYEETFIKNIEIKENSDEILINDVIKYPFSDQLTIDKSIYDKGIKIFIGIL